MSWAQRIFSKAEPCLIVPDIPRMLRLQTKLTSDLFLGNPKAILLFATPNALGRHRPITAPCQRNATSF